MKMKMKNNKTMLALVLVAALALCSVAVIADAHEKSDAISVDHNSYTIEAGEDVTLDKPLNLVAVKDGTANAVVATAFVNGKLTGTVNFYDADPKADTTTDANIIATIKCDKVSGVIFKNTAVTAGNTVTVTGSMTGTFEIVSGTISLGVYSTTPADVKTFSGSLKVSDGTIDSSCTSGTIVAIDATSKGAVVSGITYGLGTSNFGGIVKATGLSNKNLGNELVISNDGKKITGTVAKQDINGASAIGTGVNSEYAIVYGGTLKAVTFNGDVAVCSDLTTAGYDLTGLKAGKASSNAGVTGDYTGTLTFNADVTTGATYKVDASAVVVNDKKLTVPETGSAVNVTGQLINNGDIQMKAAITLDAAGMMANYGTFYAPTAFAPTAANFCGVYYQGGEPAGKYGFATLSSALEAAGSATVSVYGSFIINEAISVATTQSLEFVGSATAGVVYIDGESVVTVAGTFKNTSAMIIASDAKLNLSTATIGNDNPTIGVDVNGTLIMKSANVGNYPQTNIGKVTADVKTVDTPLTSFINLYTALATTTTSGSEITLLDDATLNKSATLATGVKFLNGGKGLVVAKDVVFTADGSFQFTTAGALQVDGKLLIKDETADGSSIGTGTTTTLNGTIVVENNAKFTSESAINSTTAPAGQIEVLGTFTVKADTGVNKLIVSGTMITDASGKKVVVAEEATISGTYTETDGDFEASKKITLTGEFTNVLGTATFTDAVITGTLTASNAVTLNGITYVGTEPKGFPYTNSAVIESAGKITIGTNAGVVIYGAADGAEHYFTTPQKTTFFIGDDVYAVEFASAAGAPLKLLKVDFVGKELSGWYNAPVDGLLITENSNKEIGDSSCLSVYGRLVDKTFDITFSHVQNGNWVVNGIPVDGKASVTYNADGYKIDIYPNAGYELKDVGILVNGQAISDKYAPVDGDVISISGKIVEKSPSSSGGPDIITILLIIITVVIIIMAVIIALKLLRS